MVRFVRALLTAAAAVFVAVLMMNSAAPLQGSAQTKGPGPTPAQVAPFAGDWLVNVAMQAIESTFVLSVKTDGGKVTATIRSETQPTVTVSDLSMAGNSLVLKYTTEYGGNSIPTVMTLTPQGQGLRAQMSMMEG